MRKLMLKIREDTKENKISFKEIAKNINVSAGQITNYFNMTNIIPFSKFIDLLNFVYSGRYPECFVDVYIRSLINKKKIENAKEAVEWFFINGYEERIIAVVNKYKDYDPFFQIYNLFYLRSRKRIDKNTFLKELDICRENGLSSIEAKSAYRIANLYGVLDFQGYVLMEFLSGEALETISKLDNDFLKGSFHTRIYEMKAICNLMNNNLKEAEEICKLIIERTDGNRFPFPICSMLSVLSEIYAFRDKNKALEFNKKGFDMLKLTGQKNIHVRSILESTHDFIKIFHGDTNDLYLTDPAEKAHYLAMKGTPESRNESVTILDEIERKNGTLSPYQIYYKALALMDEKLLEKAEYEFIKRGNIYYSFLPKWAKSNLF